MLETLVAARADRILSEDYSLDVEPGDRSRACGVRIGPERELQAQR
jgi:hypothetical protein